MNPFHGVIAVEGKRTEDGRFVKPYGLRLPFGSVPVMRYGSHGYPIGQITELHREDNHIHAAGVVRLDPGRAIRAALT